MMMNCETKAEKVSVLPDVEKDFIDLINRLMRKRTPLEVKELLCVLESIEARIDRPSWFRRGTFYSMVPGTEAGPYQAPLDRINSILLARRGQVDAEITSSNCGVLSELPSDSVATAGL